ncbi:Nucleotidyltransferase [Mytilinidion resinicola]|uniref:DNA polymerase n=1 Tax=Mytilinidion resinicola TaxID=574789 RepID=A0A6A6XYH5_9PEZI|nr:Nucleotidyltransferase [Mytilinidion resinicola]KAF2801328.1 Nucleotidyltransferase [Mytilinidion resinicola]
MEDITSSQTLADDGPEREGAALDLSAFPPFFILTSHFQKEDIRVLEEQLTECGARLSYDHTEVRLFIGKVGTKRRAEFELRIEGETTEDESLDIAEPIGTTVDSDKTKPGSLDNPIGMLDDDSTAEGEASYPEDGDQRGYPKRKRDSSNPLREITNISAVESISNGIKDAVTVIKVEWLQDSIAARNALPLDGYMVYQGKLIDQKTASPAVQHQALPALRKAVPRSQHALARRPHTAQSILERAQADAAITPACKPRKDPFRSRREGARQFENTTFASQSQRHGLLSTSHAAHLLQQTTSEYEGESSDIPEPPAWVKAKLKYACQRQTPPNPPNDPFIDELKKIRKARLLTGDEIGVRAYSTSIAALAAYPYHLTSPKEILSLPGCDVKTANLWVEYKNTGHLQAADDAENDEVMRVLGLFYDIWGVGAPTAREFYFANHWRDLDDVIEHGWSSLTRVQQIGVKYYDEFKEAIPRAEVEAIATTIHAHAMRVRNARTTCTIVGGYRRGNATSGDVDVILSHPDLGATANLVADVAASLEDEGWITHTLTLSLHGTHRGQATLPFRASGPAGHGFDTLDKALVVWQNVAWASRAADRAANPRAKNPNVHRRVDIIVAPWRTVGCAVMGWSGGTTFQRDLRRYAKAVKGWKFDSSGVRDRRTGMVVELEGEGGMDGTPEEAERRVFEGMGLAFVEPEMRCTG